MVVSHHHIDIQDIHYIRTYFTHRRNTRQLFPSRQRFLICNFSIMNCIFYRPYGSFHHASPYAVSAPIPPPTIPSPSASPRTVDTKPGRDYPHVRRISPNSEKSMNSENSEKPVAPVSVTSLDRSTRFHYLQLSLEIISKINI